MVVGVIAPSKGAIVWQCSDAMTGTLLCRHDASSSPILARKPSRMVAYRDGLRVDQPAALVQTVVGYQVMAKHGGPCGVLAAAPSRKKVQY